MNSKGLIHPDCTKINVREQKLKKKYYIYIALWKPHTNMKNKRNNQTLQSALSIFICFHSSFEFRNNKQDLDSTYDTEFRNIFTLITNVKES